MVTYNYTMEDGLPTNQVLFSMQDSKGYMWFGTGGGGAVRYDGANFEIFDISDGMLTNEVYQIFEDHLGKIWFASYAMELCYLYNDTIFHYEHNEALKNYPTAIRTIKSLHVDENNNVFLFRHGTTALKINAEGIVSPHSHGNISGDIIKFKDGSLHNSIGQFKSKKDIEGIQFSLNLAYYQEGHTDTTTTLIEFPYQKRSKYGMLNRQLVVENKEKILLINNFNLVEFDNQLNLLKIIDVEDEIGYEPINAYQIDNRVWILTRYGGIKIGVMDGNNFRIEQEIFEEYFITTLTTDRQGGLWFTSHKNGIFHILYPEIKSISKEGNWDENIKNLAVIDNHHLVLSYRPNSITIIDEENATDIDLSGPKDAEVQDITYNSDKTKLYILAGRDALEMDLNNKKIHKVNTGFIGSAIFREGNQDTLFFAGGSGIGAVVKGIPIEFTLDYPSRIQDFVVRNDTISLGTLNGYFEMTYNEDGVKNIENIQNREDNFLNGYIKKIEPSNGGVWLASQGNGIVFYKDSIQSKIEVKDGLLSSQINNLKKDGDTLWVSTNNGLNKIVLNKRSEIISIESFNTNNGISSNLIAGVECTKDFLFISTEKGYDKVRRSQMSNNLDIAGLKIDKLITLKDQKDFSNKTSLSHSKNDVAVHYQAVQYNATGNHQFRYRLLPQNEQWKNTIDHHVEFNDLIPNKYTFQVEIKNNQGFWVEQSEIQFTIAPPFYKTWWFILLTFLVLSLLIYSILKNREKKFRDKVNTENQIKFLKDKALRAQVNPHFIFNTLNSIQNFVLQGDFEKSNKFITSFSKLIRMILQQSNHNFIKVADEISMLDKYLELEQMRFGNNFEFNITLDSEIDINSFNIPPMLIQPFVENAVWHGLLNKKEKGVIEITFSMETKETIRCTVKDNGIGIEAGKKIKNETSKNRKSMGMSLTNSRLKELSTQKEKHVEIKELKDENHQVAGTQVKILIPILNPDQ